MSEELTSLDATTQAELIARKEVSAAELVAASIAQAERVNGTINAIIHPRFEKALQEAASPMNGPFAGVPLVLKDLGASMAGEPHHMGTRFLKNANYIASRDSYLTQRFRNAGFIVIGRTNTPEFGNTITTEPLSYGPSRNPWNTNHSTGGSSGGSAASVASHVVPVGHANDGGGSIRIPASECGLVGLKPSRGRVSKGPDLGESWMGSTIDGCVTRTVRDTAAVLDVICGYEPGDPYTAPPFARPLAEELNESPGRLKIGVLDHPLFAHQLDDSESRESVRRTAEVLSSLGHEVSVAWPTALENEESAGKFTAIVAAWTHTDVSYFESVLGRELGEGDLEPDNILMRELGRRVTTHDYLANMQWLHSWCRSVVEWWEPRNGSAGFDILVTPTLAGPPPPIGRLAGEHGGRNLREILAYTSQFNLTGQPAISLPLHWSNTGLPMGVQFVAAPFREDVLIRLASQLEQAMPWSHRVAPLVANS
jgi:amidase